MEQFGHLYCISWVLLCLNMEEDLLAAIFGNANDQEMEYLFLDSINFVRQPDHFELNNLMDEEISGRT